MVYGFIIKTLTVYYCVGRYAHGAPRCAAGRRRAVGAAPYILRNSCARVTARMGGVIVIWLHTNSPVSIVER